MATTDETRLPTTEAAGPGQAPQERSQRVRELLSQQQSRLDRLESELAQRLQDLSDEVARELALGNASDADAAEIQAAQLAALKQQFDSEREILSSRIAQFSQINEQLEEKRLEAAKLEHELRLRDALLTEAETSARQQRQELATLREEQAALEAKLAAEREQAAPRDTQLVQVQALLEEARLEAARLVQDIRLRDALVAEAEKRQQEQQLALAEANERQAAAKHQIELQRQQLSSRGKDDSQLRGELDEALLKIARLSDELQQARVELERAEGERRIRESLLADDQTTREEQCRQLAEARQQLAEARAQLQASQERQERLRQELSQHHESRGVAEEETVAQRRRIARKFKSQHAEHLAEYERRETKLRELAAEHDAESAAKLASAQREATKTREQLEDLQQQSRGHEEELAQAARKIETLSAETRKLRQALDEAKRLRDDAVEATGQAQRSAADPVELSRLRAEHAELSERLTEAQDQLAVQESANDPEKKNDLQRRFEMAVEDLRELKKTNAELEAKIKARGLVPSAGSGGGSGMDWESQKQRMLAALEADGDDTSTPSPERQTIEGTLRITDQIVAHKDAEIADLRRLLEAQATSQGTTAVGAAAVADLLDRDDLIRQERHRLQQVEAEWREKIGKAEIDISMERAKIGRERAELEEKIRQYERDTAGRGPAESGEQGKAPRGRWLAMLGLKDLEDQH